MLGAYCLESISYSRLLRDAELLWVDPAGTTFSVKTQMMLFLVCDDTYIDSSDCFWAWETVTVYSEPVDNLFTDNRTVRDHFQPSNAGNHSGVGGGHLVELCGASDAIDVLQLMW